MHRLRFRLFPFFRFLAGPESPALLLEVTVALVRDLAAVDALFFFLVVFLLLIFLLFLTTPARRPILYSSSKRAWLTARRIRSSCEVRGMTGPPARQARS